MKIVFLDVDGVLNCADFFKTAQTARDLSPREVDPYKVLLLHRIVEATGAKVVVSSSWRLHPEGLANVKKWVDPHYLDRTPRHARFEDRHAEIREWLEKNKPQCNWTLGIGYTCQRGYCPGHPIEKYAILDDDIHAGIGHGKNFFKTEWYGEGLTDEIAQKVIEHLL